MIALGPARGTALRDTRQLDARRLDIMACGSRVVSRSIASLVELSKKALLWKIQLSNCITYNAVILCLRKMTPYVHAVNGNQVDGFPPALSNLKEDSEILCTPSDI